jgi:hypothetical protein
LNWESGGYETNALKKFKERNKEKSKPATILRRMFTQMNCEIGGFIRFDSSRAGYHLVLGFKLYVRCRLVADW